MSTPSGASQRDSKRIAEEEVDTFGVGGGAGGAVAVAHRVCHARRYGFVRTFLVAAICQLTLDILRDWRRQLSGRGRAPEEDGRGAGTSRDGLT